MLGFGSFLPTGQARRSVVRILVQAASASATALTLCHSISVRRVSCRDRYMPATATMTTVATAAKTVMPVRAPAAMTMPGTAVPAPSSPSLPGSRRPVFACSQAGRRAAGAGEPSRINRRYGHHRAPESGRGGHGRLGGICHASRCAVGSCPMGGRGQVSPARTRPSAWGASGPAIFQVAYKNLNHLAGKISGGINEARRGGRAAAAGLPGS